MTRSIRGQTDIAARANPSAWRVRLPLAVLAAAGCAVATYLALYQLGVLPSVWEPFFGNGSERVLHSFVSRILPVPDAALGAAAYAAELSAGVIGGGARSRTMPWLVLGYGAIVIAVALSAIVLAFVQIFVIRAACTLCLTSAAISIVIAWLARPEVRASLRQVREVL